MTRPQQEFTFINVTAGRQQNTRTIKRHVSNQTNRRKRQEAVRRYQESLLEEGESSASVETSSSSSDCHRYDEPSCTTCSALEPTKSIISNEASDLPEQERHPDFAPRRGVASRQPFQLVDYWDNYVRWADRHLSSRHHSDPDEYEERRRKLKKKWKIAPSPSRSHVWISVSQEHVILHIPRIDPPTDQHRMEWGFRLCSDFIQSEYESDWKSSWQDRTWYQGSLVPVGVWRECFPLAVEFIQVGKLQQAFFLLNAAFNVTPAFFKENTPALLTACLGAMMWTCRLGDQRLAALIRSHITQLSMAHLGPRHPISMILREQMRAAEAADGQVNLLSIVVLDTFAEIFGPGHVIPLSMRWGYLRHEYASGDYTAANETLNKLEKYWNDDTMPAGSIPRFLAFDRAKTAKLEQTSKKQDVSNPIDLMEAAESSIQLPVFIPGKGPDLAAIDSAILMKLGKHLLINSHYALAVYIYAHIHIVFSHLEKGQLPTPNQDPESLPATVARILIDHLRDEMESSSEEVEKVATGSKS